MRWGDGSAIAKGAIRLCRSRGKRMADKKVDGRARATELWRERSDALSLVRDV